MCFSVSPRPPSAPSTQLTLSGLATTQSSSSGAVLCSSSSPSTIPVMFNRSGTLARQQLGALWERCSLDGTSKTISCQINQDRGRSLLTLCIVLLRTNLVQQAVCPQVSCLTVLIVKSLFLLS